MIFQRAAKWWLLLRLHAILVEDGEDRHACQQSGRHRDSFRAVHRFFSSSNPAVHRTGTSDDTQHFFCKELRRRAVPDGNVSAF
jgi:hypothetical protein